MSKFFPFMLLPFFIWAQEAALKYKAALENARRDARIIAETLGKKLGRITGISTRTNSFRQLSHDNAMRIPSVQSLIEIKQTVAARTNLKVTFELK